MRSPVLSCPRLCRLLAFACGLLPFLLPAADAPKFELKDGDRVLFLGDTFFEREVDYGHLETRLTAAFPDRSVTFRNLGWAADTPLGRARASFDWNKPGEEWLKRVKEQVALVKPTVAFLSYGMTAALELAETPAAEQPAKLEQFKADLGRLMAAIEEVSGQQVRFVLPGVIWWHLTDTPEARQVDAAVQAVEKAIAEVATARGARQVSPEKAEARVGGDFAARRESGGVVPNEAGFRLYAAALARELAGEAAPTLSPTDWSGPLPPAEAVLNAAIRKKNDLFFHRWRPANWTYLFGFRKHEQGQNAVEIPKFDPLVEEWDRRIARLRDLRNQDPAVVAEVKTLTAPKTDHRDPNFQPQPRPTFDVHDGLEVTLWAENPMLYKPIQMNWDPQGRLWVASSRMYPQIKPGQDAEDAVIVLEDTDGDGRADKSTVFADGLHIPTGVVPDGMGGCYVAASHQLLHFADTDGDGKADRRTIVMSSFGTEDTHHNLHTLRWGYDGHLYLNQSIYTHTHVETPWGVRRLNSAGIWRWNPDTWRLDIFTKGGCNPWGHHWDQWGNHFFTDGAGFKGIYHAIEGGTYFTYADMRREGESISPGNYPKFASLEVIHSPAFPAEWQGHLVTCDFRAHRLVRFALQEVGSTFQTVEQPDLLRSTNVTFRPIDVRLGPDGALYIADWSNPIIQHGEVDFRDPRRDHEHGRVWRVAMKSGVRSPELGVRDLTRQGNAELLELTLSKSGWAQEQARLVLRQRGAEKVLPELDGWLARQTNPRAKLEAMWLREAFGAPNPALIGRLVTADDPRLRTAAARQLAR